MEENRVQKIGEFSYFVAEHPGFENTIVNYDPRMANLTIVSQPSEEQPEVPEEE